MTKEEVRVVIVEDDADIRESFAMLLEADGYTVLTFGDGEAALAALGAFKPSCVLVDLGLPGMDGAAVAKRLRSEVGTELVVIAITATASQAERDRLEVSGVDFVLSKPLAADGLRRFLPPLN